MIYSVKFKHVFPVGSREIEYKVYVDDSEIDGEIYADPKVLVVEYAVNKFFREGYCLLTGSSLEVLSVEKISQ